MLKKILLIIAGVAVALLALKLSAVFVSSRGFTVNDLSIIWLLDGKGYFIDEAGISRTNHELQILDNSEESFRTEKSSGTFRIFAIGGSTTRGWPFQYILSYPKILNMYFRDLLPGRNIEIINAGFHGSDSTSDLRLVSEIMQYKPDLLLIYEGRNEQSNLKLRSGWRTKLLRTHIQMLRHFPLYRRFNAFYDSDFNHAVKIRRFVNEQYLFDSEELLKTALLSNLKSISDKCRAADCGMVILAQLESRKFTDMGKINQYLKEFAEKEKLPFIDINSAYAGSRLSNADLMMEKTTHPDVEGYLLISKAICRALSENNIIAPSDAWRWHNLKSDKTYLKELRFDSEALDFIYRKRLFPILTSEDEKQALRANVTRFRELYE